MIIVCLVLVVAAFVVIGTALALAELTLVYVALALGGLSAVLLAVEFVRGGRSLLGRTRPEERADSPGGDATGIVTGVSRTDGLGKASVRTTSIAAPVPAESSRPPTGTVDTPAPAPVFEPVRAALLTGPPERAFSAPAETVPSASRQRTGSHSKGVSAESIAAPAAQGSPFPARQEAEAAQETVTLAARQGDEREAAPGNPADPPNPDEGAGTPTNESLVDLADEEETVDLSPSPGADPEAATEEAPEPDEATTVIRIPAPVVAADEDTERLPPPDETPETDADTTAVFRRSE